MKKFKFEGVRFSKWMTEFFEVERTLEEGDYSWEGEYGLPTHDSLVSRLDFLRSRVFKVVDGVPVGDLFGLTRVSDGLKMVVLRLPDESDGPRYLCNDSVCDLHDLAQNLY
jgi:hypothetical protein